MPRDVQKRLFNKRRVDPETGCWVWTGSKTRDGYGQIQFNGQIQRVHRVAYERLIGPIDEETLHHKCAVRLCFNPEHLQPCSRRENIAEMHERQYYERTIEKMATTIAELESRLSSGI
jgi:hypothetical protein